MRKKYKIEVDCANCALKMEDAAKKVIGVKDVTINFIMQKMIVDFEDNVNEMFVMSEVRKACKHVVPDSEIH